MTGRHERIPRFLFPDMTRSEAIRAHLVSGSGAIAVQHASVTAGSHRRDLASGDPPAIDLGKRYCSQTVERYLEGMVKMRETVRRIRPGDEAISAVPAWPYAGMTDEERSTHLLLSVRAILLLDRRDRWTAAPIVGDEVLELGYGDLILARGSVPIGWTVNGSPESRWSYEALFIPPWLRAT